MLWMRVSVEEVKREEKEGGGYSKSKLQTFGRGR